MLKFFGLWFSFTCITLSIIYSFKLFSLPATVQISLFFIYGLSSALLGLLWMIYAEKLPGEQIQYLLEKIIRYSLAYIISFYAIGKIFDLQFIVQEEIKTQRAGELSGFSKAWLFFDHSYRYGLFIAIGQLLAAALLVMDKTKTAGAFLYFVIMANIVVMDFEYGVVSMQQISLLLLAMCTYLLAADRKKLFTFFFSAPFYLSGPGYIKNKRWQSVNFLFFILLAAGLINELLFFYKLKYGG